MRHMKVDPYKKNAKLYDTFIGPLTSGLRALGMKMFPPREGMAVLDVGCGTGIHLELYQKAGCNVYGIDQSPSMLQVARNRLGESASLYMGDASNMPYQDKEFDLIVMSTVLLYKSIITFIEFAAGGEHFKNYHDFIANKGLPAIASAHGLSIDKKKIVSGGNIALFLLRAD